MLKGWEDYLLEMSENVKIFILFLLAIFIGKAMNNGDDGNDETDNVE